MTEETFCFFAYFSTSSKGLHAVNHDILVFLGITRIAEAVVILCTIQISISGKLSMATNEYRTKISPIKKLLKKILSLIDSLVQTMTLSIQDYYTQNYVSDCPIA